MKTRAFAAACIATLLVAGCGRDNGEMSDLDALGLCQYALKRASRDPDKADIPYVPNHGSGAEFYFAWGSETRMAHMRNGLGLDVPVSASCVVSKSARKITSLTLDGKTLI